MNTKENAQLAPALAAAAIAAPPLFVGAVIGLGLLWLFSQKGDAVIIPSEETNETPAVEPEENPAPPISELNPSLAATEQADETLVPAPVFNARITREDVAEALEYGERMFTRKEAVQALQELGFQKSAAYKALSFNGKFGTLLEFTPDGLIEWKG